MASGSASATKRIQRELKEISESPSRHWTAGPAEDDMFEWHFAVRGPPGTDFEGGIYTGRFALPINYPMAPPSVTLLTPNGRWEIQKKICLSNSSYHPELWQPAWGIRTMMEALRAHFPAAGDGAIGSLDWPSDIRKRLAKESLDYVCTGYGKKNRELLPELSLEELKEETPDHIPLELRADASPSATPAAAADGTPEVSTAPAATEGSDPAVAPSSAPVATNTSTEQASSAPLSRTPEAASSDGAVPAAMASPSAAGGSTSATDGTSRRRRADAANPQRRRPASSVFKQLFRPPETRRQALLLTIDALIFLLLLSFMYVVVDIMRHPPANASGAAESSPPQ